MGLILDFVPNHMGLDASANPWWHDVLEHGQSSPVRRLLRHRLGSGEAGAQGRILLPILQDEYGDVLDRGELQLGFERGALHLEYFDAPPAG